jgi:probable rRNA maturation factor
MSPDGSLLLYRRAGSGLPRRVLREFADTLRDQVAQGQSFTCLLTDDRELQRLNRTFLGKDYATDVLSFPSGDGGALGDIAISVERAIEQAAAHGHTTEHELKILMLHGVLHLLGHDHEQDRGAMARLERRWRRELDLPEGLIERSRGAKAR